MPETISIPSRPTCSRSANRTLPCEHTFVDREATILHADVDAFFAAVEQRDDPRLRGRPVIVGGWVALAASYEAKAKGIPTPMGAGPSIGCSRTRHRRSRDSRSTRRSSTFGGLGVCWAARSRSRYGYETTCARRWAC